MSRFEQRLGEQGCSSELGPVGSMIPPVHIWVVLDKWDVLAYLMAS